MPADTRVKVGTSWRQISADGIYGHDAGAFQQIDFGYMKSGGTWRTTYIRDNTGPAAPTGVQAKWENGGLRVTWNNPGDSDYDRMQLVFYPRGEPYLSIIEVDSPGESYLFTNSYIRNYQIYDVLLRGVDTNDNVGPGVWEASMEFTGIPRGRTPSAINFAPIDSGTWDDNNNLWRTDVPGGDPRTVIQGTTISRTNRGVFFYGSNLWTYLRGATITGARLDLWRQNTTGQTAPVTPEMYWSSTTTSKASNPETGTTFDRFEGVAMSRLSSPPPYGQSVLPSTWRTAIGASVLASSLRSIIFWSADQTIQPGLGNVSNSYMTMWGAGTGPFFTLVPGNLYITHSG